MDEAEITALREELAKWKDEVCVLRGRLARPSLCEDFFYVYEALMDGNFPHALEIAEYALERDYAANAATPPQSPDTKQDKES